jgi:hypothetical protein
MSGTITDIRTWSKGADSEVPSPAWNIYVDSQGQLWWHEQNSVKWTQILFEDTWRRLVTSEVPDGARQLVRMIADEVLAELLPADSDESGE